MCGLNDSYAAARNHLILDDIVPNIENVFNRLLRISLRILSEKIPPLLR